MVYTTIDDLSNLSLVRSYLFDVFNVDFDGSSYYLKTCAEVFQKTGRKAYRFQVASVDVQVIISLRTLIECDDNSDDCSEIPTPQVALHHPHLKDIAGQICEIDLDTPVMMLLVRDIIKVKKSDALKLDLGWVIVSNVCLGKVQKPDRVNVFFTNTLVVASHFSSHVPTLITSNKLFVMKKVWEDEHHVELDVFKRTKDDEKLALSAEDLTFL